MSQELVPARLTCLVAIDANKAVVLREKPHRRFQALLWEFNEDVVSPGQWLNAKIDTRRCDVSPDGSLMVIGAIDYRRRPPHKRVIDPETKDIREWTAISRPPYFSALTLFECTFFYGSGGVWLDNNYLIAFGDYSNAHISAIPEHVGLAGGFVPWEMKFLLGGWAWEGVRGCEVSENVRKLFSQARLQESRSEKISAFYNALFQFSSEINGDRFQQRHSILSKQIDRTKIWHSMYPDRYWLTLDEKVLELPFEIDWADFSDEGVLKLAGKGCLWTWPGAPFGEPALITDLTPNKFENVKAPDWALQW